MLRDKSLIPLSRQHQHALALCVRIDGAKPIPNSELEAWQTEIEQLFGHEIKVHFSAEERVLFPAARRFPELIPLVEELIAEQASLREWFSEAQDRYMSGETLSAFAQQLSSHIRQDALAAVVVCNGTCDSRHTVRSRPHRCSAILRRDRQRPQVEVEEIISVASALMFPAGNAFLLAHRVCAIPAG